MTGDSVDHRRHGDATGTTAEAAPLLGSRAPPRPPRRPSHRPTLSVGSVASLRSVHVPKVHKSSTIVGLLCVIIAIATSSTGFMETPVLRALEALICRDYYSRDDGSFKPGEEPIDEKLCKVASIQTDVQDIMSTMTMLTAIISCVFALPWGLAADR